MEKQALFLLLALLAEIIGTVSGFGSSILFVPIASLFFDFKIVLGITAIFHVFSNLSKIALFREGVEKDIVIKLGIPAVVFVIIGALLTNYIPIAQMEFIMNIMLVVLSIFLLFYFNKPLQQSNKNLYLGGIISGFLAGLLGTGGAIRGITLTAFQLPKNIFVATSAVIDLGVDSSRAIVYIAQGYFDTANLYLIPFLVVTSLVGSFIGKIILKHTSEKVFRYLVLAIIIASAAYQIMQYIQAAN